MPVHTWLRRRRVSLPLLISVLSLMVLAQAAEGPPKANNWLPDTPKPTIRPVEGADHCPQAGQPDPLLGARTKQPGRWLGRQAVSPTLPIVVMAGHADSQNMPSAGTPGYAVDVQRQRPMDAAMRDELFWNIEVQDEVVRQGKEAGLNIRGYRPPALTILNDNDPRTNWSQARTLSARGEYILEIHFDAYSPHGFGSGLIPAINRPLNRVDEALGQAFGRFPVNFRGGLGGPRRGIGILEIGMLEPPLETKLRDPATRDQTVECLAERVVNALVKGVS